MQKGKDRGCKKSEGDVRGSEVQKGRTEVGGGGGGGRSAKNLSLQGGAKRKN